MGEYIDNFYIVNLDDNRCVIFDYEQLNISVGAKNRIGKDDFIPNNSAYRLKYNDEIGKLEQLKCLVICSAEICNLACEYCFANKGFYNNDGSKDIVHFDEYKKMYDKLLIIFEKGTESIEFFGGEPLLGFEDIKKFVLYVEAVSKEHDIPIPVFSMITNGVLLNKEVVSFANEHKIHVTVSIDVNKEIHDLYRVKKDGTGSYDMICQNMKNIKENKNRRFLCTCESTIGKDFLLNYSKGGVDAYYKDFYNIGADGVATFLVDSREEISLDYEKKIDLFYRDIADNTFQLILNNDSYRKILPFVLDIIVNIVTNRRKRECRVGKTTLFYTIGGDLYPCQMFYQANTCYLGNLYDENTNIRENMKQLHKVKRTEIKECQKCFCKNVCQAWCEGSSVVNNGESKSVIETRCIMQKALTEQILINLVKITENKEINKKFIHNIKKLGKIYSADNIRNLGELE